LCEVGRASKCLAGLGLGMFRSIDMEGDYGLDLMGTKAWCGEDVAG
jgi:hypothetical protein